jgi:hypothetical protein
MICKSGAQTLDGSKSSSMRIINSPTGQTARYLMSQELRTKKCKLFKYMVTTVERTKDGMLSIWTKQIKLDLRE